MPDPFRGEICAAFLDYLADQEPEVLQRVMESIAQGCSDPQVRERTRDVYLSDLAYANDPTATVSIPYPGAI